MSQLSWILASLAAHAAVFSLALMLPRQAHSSKSTPKLDNATQAGWIAADEVELLAPVVPAAPEHPSNEAVPNEPRGANDEATLQDEKQLSDEALSANNDSVRLSPKPEPQAEPEQPPRSELPASGKRDDTAPARHADEPSQQAASSDTVSRAGESEPSSDGADWLSLDDQLPAETTSDGSAARKTTQNPTRESPSTSAPQRDELVERLLAAERRKAARHNELSKDVAASTPKAEPGESTTVKQVTAGKATRGVEDLGYRFTLAVTEAEKGNPMWEMLPLGEVGSIRFKLRLENGRVLPEPEVTGDPPHVLEKLVHKTLFLLRRGRFTLPFSQEQNGEQWFDIDVRLSSASGVDRLASEPPTLNGPGRAYMVRAKSGRRFDATVYLDAR